MPVQPHDWSLLDGFLLLVAADAVAIVAVAVVALAVTVLFSSGKILFDSDGHFWLQYLQWPLGEQNNSTAMLPVSSSPLLIINTSVILTYVFSPPSSSP